MLPGSENGFSASSMDVDIVDVFEIKVSDQVEAMRRTRTGAIVGIDLAHRFGWKLDGHLRCTR